MNKEPIFTEVKNKGNVKLRTFTTVEIEVPNNWNNPLRKYAFNILEKEIERLEMRIKYV